jgi:hypothetical protein
MEKVILKMQSFRVKDEFVTSIMSISAIDALGKSIPVSGRIDKLRIYGNKIIVPNDLLLDEQELIIESE